MACAIYTTALPPQQNCTKPPHFPVISISSIHLNIDANIDKIPLSLLLPRPRRGLRGIVFTRSVCVCVCVCPANILIFYCSATRRDIDLKLIQDIYRHRSKVKVTGTVHGFLKVQSYHKNLAIENVQYFFVDTSPYALSTETIKT